MTLSYADQRDLDRYFQLGHLEKSTAGPMLERAWLFSLDDAPRVPESSITARPTAEQMVPAKSEPSTSDLELIGRVSRKMAMIKPLYKRALEAFHGDKGACCAAKMKTHGRIVALFELTKAGRALAKRARLAQGKSKLDTRDDELIQNAVARHDVNHGGESSATVTQALVQALELKEAAESAYTAATMELAQSRTKRPIPPAIPIRGADDDD